MNTLLPGKISRRFRKSAWLVNLKYYVKCIGAQLIFCHVN